MHSETPDLSSYVNLLPQPIRVVEVVSKNEGMTEKEIIAFSKGKLAANSGLLDMLKDARLELRTLKSLLSNLSDSIRGEHREISSRINDILNRDE